MSATNECAASFRFKMLVSSWIISPMLAVDPVLLRNEPIVRESLLYELPIILGFIKLVSELLFDVIIEKLGFELFRITFIIKIIFSCSL